MLTESHVVGADCAPQFGCRGQATAKSLLAAVVIILPHFFRPTPCGFRQVVQQLSKTVANEINYLIRTGAVAVVAAKVNWKKTDT